MKGRPINSKGRRHITDTKKVFSVSHFLHKHINKSSFKWKIRTDISLLLSFGCDRKASCVENMCNFEAFWIRRFCLIFFLCPSIVNGTSYTEISTIYFHVKTHTSQEKKLYLEKNDHREKINVEILSTSNLGSQCAKPAGGNDIFFFVIVLACQICCCRQATMLVDSFTLTTMHM